MEIKGIYLFIYLWDQKFNPTKKLFNKKKKSKYYLKKYHRQIHLRRYKHPSRTLCLPFIIRTLSIVCLAWRCGGFLSKVQYFLSTNHTFKNYKNILFTKKKKTSYLSFKHPNSDFQLKAAKSKWTKIMLFACSNEYSLF